MSLLSLFLLAGSLTPDPTMLDDDNDDVFQPEPCPEPIVDSAGALYLNGLPLVQEDLEIVGNAVKVWIQLPPQCRGVTPPSPPFEWRVVGPTPQLVPVDPWAGAGSYRLLEGRVEVSRIAGHDNELNHYFHDAIVEVVPDARFRHLKVPAVEGNVKETMEVEWETRYFPGAKRPLPGDRISAVGFYTYDCHHNDPTFGILTEIHPPVLTAVHRKRPVRIPDGWQGLGNNIHVPGIVTDVHANKRAGEMTSNCSSSIPASGTSPASPWRISTAPRWSTPRATMPSCATIPPASSTTSRTRAPGPRPSARGRAGR